MKKSFILPCMQKWNADVERIYTGKVLQTAAA